jgi:2-oxoglutarate ferredoxin oxidoreductase subunit delta
MPEKKTFKITHNRKWCKDCGICVAVCPKKVYEIDRSDRHAIVNPGLHRVSDVRRALP